LDKALEAKARSTAAANEVIASLKNRESFLEREVNNGKIQLAAALEGKARAAAEYGYAVNKLMDLKDTMASMVKAEEKSVRDKAYLQELVDRNDAVSSMQSRKISELRLALRSSNDRKRRLERQLEVGTKEIESELRTVKEEKERLLDQVT